VSQQPSPKPASTEPESTEPADPTPNPGEPPRHTEEADERSEADTTTGAQVSEAGGASLNEETSEGGADAVPDTHG